MPVAGGFRFIALHFRATLRSATLRCIPFIVSLQPRLPTQECFHSFHSAQANPQFHSAPLWLSLPTFRNSKPKLEAIFHPSQFSTLHSVTNLAFPNPISGMSFEVFTPVDKKPQKPHHPLMAQVKIEDHSCMTFVLAVGLSHSFNRSVHTSLHHFISFTSSASAPHV